MCYDIWIQCPSMFEDDKWHFVKDYIVNPAIHYSSEFIDGLILSKENKTICFDSTVKIDEKQVSQIKDCEFLLFVANKDNIDLDELSDNDVKNGKYGQCKLYSFVDEASLYNMKMSVHEIKKDDQIKLFIKASNAHSFIHVKTFDVFV